MEIAEIRVLVEDLSQGSGDTDLDQLTRYGEWLSAHAQQPRPDGKGGMVVDRDIKCAAEAFGALIQAYKEQDWMAIKRRARVIHQALA
jgi:hypothetical protein